MGDRRQLWMVKQSLVERSVLLLVVAAPPQKVLPSVKLRLTFSVWYTWDVLPLHT